MLGALKRTRYVSQSVSQAVKLLKAYYLEYAPVIHPEKVASRKHVGNGPTPPWVTTYRHLHAHRFNRYSVLIPFINLPSRNCFRGIDDKCEIGTVIRVLYNVSKAAVTAVAYPMSAGKFSNSHVPIPDWIDYGAGRFTPIHISLYAVRSSPRGPHQSEWRQTSLCKYSTLNVFCCSAEE